MAKGKSHKKERAIHNSSRKTGAPERTIKKNFAVRAVKHFVSGTKQIRFS
jgi:hypothetical protein